MENKYGFHDCIKDSVILASSHAKEYPPELVIFDDLIDLNINKCSTREPPSISEIEISDDDELPNLYNRLKQLNFETFWQSCGSLPHEISFQFKRHIKVQKIEVWVNRAYEASYCPETIILVVQRFFHSFMTKTASDIEDVLVTPEFYLSRYTFEFDEEDGADSLSGFKFQILGNLEQGIDSRIHCVRIWEPNNSASGALGRHDYR